MKIKLQILGTGCAKCRLLAEHVEAAAGELGLDFELEKVTDLDEIVKLGVVATPVLVADGEVKVAGHVPTVFRLKEMLANPGRPA